MSKAGKTVLLTLLLLGVSGATTQLHAQEKLTTLSLAETKKGSICTPLQDYIFTSGTSCEEKKLTQIETAVKAQGQTNADQAVEFSYSTEPTYYIPPIETPTPTESPTLTPAQTVAPTTPNSANQTPQDMVPADGPNLNSDMIFDMINAHRTQLGKPAFQKDAALCTLAKTRSFELHDELFANHNLHSGLYNRNLPYWITEDAKWGSNEAGTVQWWLHSPIHRAAIEGDYVYSCGACNGSQCSQLFTSYTAKSGIALKTNN